MLKKLAERSWQLLLVCAAVYVLFWIAATIRVVLVPFVIGVLLTTFLFPLRQWLCGRSVPRMIAAAIPLFLLVLVPTAGVYLASATVDFELRGLATDITSGIESAKAWLSRRELMGIDLGLQLDHMERALREGMKPSGSELASGAAGLATLLTQLALVVAFTYFLLLDGHDLVQAVIERARVGRQRHLTDVATRIWSRLGSYMRGMALVALADALVFGLGLLLIGVPSVLPIMLITFLTAFVPFAGPVVATSIAVVVALGHEGLISALLVVVAGVATQVIEGNVLQPFAIGHAIHIRPLVIFLAIAIGTTVAGPIGTFVAVPAAALVKLLFDELTGASGDDLVVT